MNKQTEALRMAKQHIIERKGGRGGAVCYVKTDEDIIKAIDEALAQTQSDEYTEGYQQGYIEGWEAKKAEQPAQEPVAWVSPKTAYHFGITDKYVAGVFRYGLFDDATIPLYTHPAPSCRCEECGMKYCECGERK